VKVKVKVKVEVYQSPPLGKGKNRDASGNVNAARAESRPELNKETKVSVVEAGLKVCPMVSSHAQLPISSNDVHINAISFLSHTKNIV
jgi:hypothetical protein